MCSLQLIQFLLSLVSTKRPAMPGKRRLPMLNDVSQLSSPKIPRLSRQVGHEYNGATVSKVEHIVFFFDKSKTRIL